MAIPDSYNIFKSIILISALLSLFASSMDARATPQRRAGHSAGAGSQVTLCESFGGSGSVTPGPGAGIEIEGSKSGNQGVKDSTSCSGGLLDGMECKNYDNGSTYCSASLQAPTRVRADQVVDGLQPFEQMEDEPQSVPTSDEPVAADDDLVEADEPAPDEPVNDSMDDESVADVNDAEPTDDQASTDSTPEPVIEETVTPEPTTEPVDETTPDAGATDDMIDGDLPTYELEQMDDESDDGQLL